MTAAIRDAGIDPTDIDYVNTHGTSTPAGDIGETNAVKNALGDACEKSDDQFDEVDDRPYARCGRRC